MSQGESQLGKKSDKVEANDKLLITSQQLSVKTPDYDLSKMTSCKK